MAGIGFRLNRYFYTQGGVGKVKGALFSLILSSGPWLMTILSIAIMSAVASTRLYIEEVTHFKTILTYIYAFSLLVFGLMEMPLTKFLSDKLFLADRRPLRAVFYGALMAAFGICLLIALPAFGFLKFSFWGKLSCGVFLFSTTTVWICMVYLSAAKNHKMIFWSFLIGSIVSMVAGIWLGGIYRGEGHIIGYTLGQWLLAVLLLGAVHYEYAGPEEGAGEIWFYLRERPYLPLIGLFYYLGVWVDKFVFWYAGNGSQQEGIYYSHAYYDTALFLSFLSVVPAFAYFLVQVETKFFMKMKQLIKGIEQKNTLRQIEENKEQLRQSLRQSLFRIFMLQAVVSSALYFYVPLALDRAKALTLIATSFRYGLIAAFFQACFLMANILLYYFNAEIKVLRNYMIFFSLNITTALITAPMDFRWHGIGIALSSLITLLISLRSLENEFEQVDFKLFMGQPLGIEAKSRLV